MKKITFALAITLNIILSLQAAVLLPDYNKRLSLPPIVDKKRADKEKEEPLTLFNFNVGNVEGDLTLLGNWKLRLGFGTGFTLNPELNWLLSIAGMSEGVIFEQERLFSLDWTTDRGIYFHLFFNDDLEATEFNFRYEPGLAFNSLYIANNIETKELNPYRKLESGRAQDLNFGFDWGHRFYRGRFDFKLDSVKLVTDSFRGSNRLLEKRLLSAEFLRGLYYYLPDSNITNDVEIHLSDELGTLFPSIPVSVATHRRFRKLSENKDFILNKESGLVTFKESVYGRSVLIYYKTDISGTVYNVGDGATAFPQASNSSYYVSEGGKQYLILAFYNQHSPFEEKNSYRLTDAGSVISGLSVEILDTANVRQGGFSYSYDKETGALRIRKSQIKGDTYNLYPFYDYGPSTFYTDFYSPKQSLSKNIISYSCYLRSTELKLSEKPVPSTIQVLLNSLPLTADRYSFDFISRTITLNFEPSESDNIVVRYMTDDTESLHTTFAVGNDFRLNEHLLIGDTLWYKMPVKLWEDSYYFRMHSAELLYNLHLKGDFKKYLFDKEKGELGFNLNAGLSLFIPDLKGLTILEDFEYEATGYALNLNYNEWFPVTNNPSSPATGYGRLFFRNLHDNQVLTGGFTSVYDAVPERDSYTSGSAIGPYSSVDGISYNFSSKSFTDNRKSTSLILEYELDPNEAISVAIPINEDEIDFSGYTGLSALFKMLEANSDLRVYIDAGEISERFDSSESTVSREYFDEGLKYLAEGIHTLYKGKGDSSNIDNDFNDDGILSDDNAGSVTAFSTGGNPYATLNSGFLDVINFSIDNPERLKTIRGLRLTLYNPSGVTTAGGRLLVNQLRFTETGWESDGAGTPPSTAEEIFPAEDPLLLANIFSVNNSEMDKKLHFQRFRERTMMIELKQNDPFYVKKSFGQTVNVANFKELGLFLFLEKSTARRLRLTLTDDEGNDMTAEKDLAELGAGSWHQLTFSLSSLTGYDNSSKEISSLTIDLLNEGSDSYDNKLFLDELYLESLNPSVGFSTYNEFFYSDPGLKFKYKNIPIFDSPKVRLKTTFNTANFLKNELSPSKNYSFENSLLTSFNLLSVSFLINPEFTFIFRNEGALLSSEELRLKIFRKSTEKLPLLFTIFYDYTMSAEGSRLDFKRSLLTEIGAKFKPVNFKGGYSVESTRRSDTRVESKFFYNMKVEAADISANLDYKIINEKSNDTNFGYFSLDNMGYLFKDDYTLFFYDGELKSQELSVSSYSYLLPLVFYSNSFRVSSLGESSFYGDSYGFRTTIEGKNSFDFKAVYRGRTKSLVKLSYARNLENYSQKNFSELQWSGYFNEFANSFHQNFSIFFFPPFSSLYRSEGQQLFGAVHRFKELKDEVELTFSWQLFVPDFIFTPKSLTFKVEEELKNSVKYIKDYYFTLTLSGEGLTSNLYFKNINSTYSLSETIELGETENSYKTTAKFNLNFHLYQEMDIETGLQYDLKYTESDQKQELHHKIDFKFNLYKSFFKRNYLTNDKQGFEMGCKLEALSEFYQTFKGDRDRINSPITLTLTPMFGYRFSKNLTLDSFLKLAYSADHSPLYNEYTHKYGLEFIVQAVISF